MIWLGISLLFGLTLGTLVIVYQALKKQPTSELPTIRTIAADVERLLRRSPPPPPDPPAPFICALVEADGPNGRVAMGASGRVSKDGTALRLETQVPLKNIRVIVYCDLERVDVYGFMMGTAFMNAGLGTCPVAYYDEWKVGVILQVQCIFRREA